MNCLVTGAAGFIGSALVDRLVHDGHRVRAVLHFTRPLRQDPRVEYVTADITDPSSLPAVIHSIDIVFHCAALVKDFGSKKGILAVNLTGTKNLIDACDAKIQKFIYLGHLHNITTAHTGAYSVSKALAEQYLLEQHRTKHVPGCIIRPGNVYGPGATTWVVRPLNAIRQGRIALIENGSGLFLHTYIDNLVDALVATIDAPDITGEIIDVTDGDNQTSWRTYFNDLSAIAGRQLITRTMKKPTALLLSNLMIARYHLFHMDPLVTPTAVHILTNKRTISIEKATTLLGYHPRINYTRGMERIAQWVKEEQII